MLTTLEALKQRLGIEHDRRDAELTRLLEGVSAAILAYLGRNLVVQEYTERYNGNGKRQLVLREYPIKQVLSVEVNGRGVADFDNDDWLLFCPRGIPAGIRNVKVRYIAGHDEIPADIAEAALIIAVQRLNEIDNKGIQSKSLAGETITFSNFSQTGGIPPAAFAILQEHKRKV